MSRIDEIKEREIKATEGPWIFNPRDEEVAIANKDKGIVFDPNCDMKDEDLDFIAHTREDIPYLRAEIERQKEAMKKIVGALEGMDRISKESEKRMHNVARLALDDYIKNHDGESGEGR